MQLYCSESLNPENCKYKLKQKKKSTNISQRRNCQDNCIEYDSQEFSFLYQSENSSYSESSDNCSLLWPDTRWQWLSNYQSDVGNDNNTEIKNIPTLFEVILSISYELKNCLTCKDGCEGVVYNVKITLQWIRFIIPTYSQKYSVSDDTS